MTPAKHAHVAESLTQSEIASVFALAEAAFELVEQPSRLLFECDGDRWIERDPVTGRILATGTVGE